MHDLVAGLPANLEALNEHQEGERDSERVYKCHARDVRDVGGVFLFEVLAPVAFERAPAAVKFVKRYPGIRGNESRAFCSILEQLCRMLTGCKL